MKFIINLLISGFFLLFLIGKLPDFWIIFLFVYIPVAGAIIGILFDKFLPEDCFTIDKMTSLRTISPTAPLLVIWYFKICWYIFLPMLTAYAIFYYIGYFNHDLSRYFRSDS